MWEEIEEGVRRDKEHREAERKVRQEIEEGWSAYLVKEQEKEQKETEANHRKYRENPVKEKPEEPSMGACIFTDLIPDPLLGDAYAPVLQANYELPSMKEARLMQEHGEPWGKPLPEHLYPVYTAEDRARDNGIAFDMAERHSRELRESMRNYANDVPEPQSRLVPEQPGYEGVFGTAPNGCDISVRDSVRENLKRLAGTYKKATAPASTKVEEKFQFPHEEVEIKLPEATTPIWQTERNATVHLSRRAPEHTDINYISRTGRVKKKHLIEGIGIAEFDYPACRIAQRWTKAHDSHKSMKPKVSPAPSIIGAIKEEVAFWKKILF